MKVILKQTVKGVGKPGDIIKVSDGYARNYLLPKKLAVEATPQNMRMQQIQMDRHTTQQSHLEVQRGELAEKINALTCTIYKQASEDDRLFGSVSHIDILNCLNSQGISLEKKQVVLDKPIKSLGWHSISIHLGHGVEAALTIHVEKQS